jgi:hypothetical protein
MVRIFDNIRGKLHSFNDNSEKAQSHKKTSSNPIDLEARKEIIELKAEAAQLQIEDR